MSFNAYAEPLPLVVEVWSLTIDGYEVAAKLPLYRQRGDLEIWFLQPYERTLTVWRRQPDGSYSEERYTGGIVAVASLPGVEIDLDDFLAELTVRESSTLKPSTSSVGTRCAHPNRVA